MNIAPGSVIEEEALIDALENGRIADAALDVFADEPAIDPRFTALETVLLSPHAASLTKQARHAVVARLVGSTRAYLVDCRRRCRRVDDGPIRASRFRLISLHERLEWKTWFYGLTGEVGC